MASTQAETAPTADPGKAGVLLRRVTRAPSVLVHRLARSETQAPPDLRRSVPTPSNRSLLRISGIAMLVIALFVTGMLVYLTVLSNMSQHRSQRLLYDDFRAQLAEGSAPIGQVDFEGNLLSQGDPVAIVTIPALGVEQVVVEGTTSRTMRLGPGHRRDTPLPGQEGVSVVYGRQTAFGGPFSDISSLKAGDQIQTATGQGLATYTVTGVRYAGDPVPAMPSSGARLTLVSADGTPFLSNRVVRVDADINGKPQLAPQPVLQIGSLTDSEEPLASDPSAWLPLFLLLELAIVVVLALIWGVRRWGRWHIWIVGVPVALAVGVEIATQTAVVLPNLY